MPETVYLSGAPNNRALTIALNASQSDAFDVDGARNIEVVVPDQWTTADIGLLVSDEKAGTYIPLYTSNGVRVKVTGVKTAAAAAYQFPESAWQIQGWPWAKLESLDVADESAEAQTAARSLQVRRLR